VNFSSGRISNFGSKVLGRLSAAQPLLQRQPAYDYAKLRALVRLQAAASALGDFGHDRQTQAAAAV
jgi:hypothetical protein